MTVYAIENEKVKGKNKVKGIQIISTGRALPKQVVTNDDLGRIVDTNDEWITTRTGIKTRYKCEDETCISLAVSAAKAALDKAHIDKSEIGAVIVATTSSEYAFPSVACMVQKELGLDEEITAFDISSACTGFLHAMAVGRALLGTMKKRYVLLVGSERMSSLLDYTDRSTCVLFGDGAGAAIIGASDNIYYQKSWARGNDEVLSCPGAGRGPSFLSMKGNDVFRFAVTVLKQAVDEALKEAGMTMDDIDYCVCHQANIRIIQHVQKQFVGNEHKFFANIDRYGNTSAASIPIAIDELMEAGKLKSGMKVVCVGFGAGLTWSSVLFEL